MIEVTDIAITNLSKSFNHVLKTYAYFVKQKKKGSYDYIAQEKL
jgi:hypothetical protein